MKAPASRRPEIEFLEERLAPATADPVTFAVIGDFGIASSLYNLQNILTGYPDPEGDVAALVHSWDPDFLTTLGDNNYLAGEKFDPNFALDLQFALALGKIDPASVRNFLNFLDLVPSGALGITAVGDTTMDSNVVTGLNVAPGDLAVGMIVYDTDATAANIPFPTGPDSPFFTTITSISGTTNNVTITLSAPARKTAPTASLSFLPADVSLQTLDGLSHIDRNIGRYYSDFIFPYVTSSSTGQFGSGSPTGTNRMFPVPGNHDWGDILSDGGKSATDTAISVPSRSLEKIGTLFSGATPTIVVADASGLRLMMTVLGPGLQTINQNVTLDEALFVTQRIDSINVAGLVSSSGVSQNNSTTIIGLDTTNLQAGMTVTGPGIAANTTIVSVDSDTQVTISAAAGAGAGSGSFIFDASITSAGMSSNGSTAVTGLDTTGLFRGMTVTGPGIAANTTIVTVVSATEVTVSVAADGSAGTGNFTFSGNEITLLFPNEFTIPGTSTNGGTTITGLGQDSAGLFAGMTVTGPGIAAGTTVTNVDPNTEEVTISIAAGAGADAGNFTFTPPTTEPNSTYAFLPIPLFVPPTLDPYLEYFAGLNPTDSPGFQIGTFVNGGGQTVPLDDPYYYSFTVGATSLGAPLVEFFALDSDPADPFLVNTAANPSVPTNAEVATSHQGVWLKSALGNSEALWKIVYFHHTPYSSSSEPDAGGEGEWMRLPFQQWGASAVMYGHVHNYERLSEVDPAIPGISSAGTVAIPYFLNGSGGAPMGPFNGPLDPGSQLRYNGANGAMKVVVDETRIVFQFWNTFGALIDEFILSAPPLPSLQESLAANNDFTIVGATGSPTTILSVKIFDGTGNLVGSVQPFNNLTALRVATGDFDGDGLVDGFAVMGRRASDLRAEVVTYTLDASGNATETGRFDAFAPGIFGNGYITAGDFDGDGDDDLAVAQIGGGRTVVTLQVHVNNGGAFSLGGAATIDFGSVSAPRIGAGDTDGDGFDEIVVTARTDAGARVLVFDVQAATPNQQGAGFTWDFGITGYSRGAFVAVGEFDSTFTGAEIVLGSNVGAGGRVDIVHYDGAGTATLSANGRLTPFGVGYDAAVRVAVGRLNDRNVIVAGQDRFQDGQYTILARQVNTGETNPPFESIPAITALTAADGLSPGGQILGPFVAFANLTPVIGATSLLAPSIPGADLLDGDAEDLDLAFALDRERKQVNSEEIDELFALAF